MQVRLYYFKLYFFGETIPSLHECRHANRSTGTVGIGHTKRSVDVSKSRDSADFQKSRPTSVFEFRRLSTISSAPPETCYDFRGLSTISEDAPRTSCTTWPSESTTRFDTSICNTRACLVKSFDKANRKRGCRCVPPRRSSLLGPDLKISKPGENEKNMTFQGSSQSIYFLNENTIFYFLVTSIASIFNLISVDKTIKKTRPKKLYVWGKAYPLDPTLFTTIWSSGGTIVQTRCKFSILRRRQIDGKLVVSDDVDKQPNGNP